MFCEFVQPVYFGLLLRVWRGESIVQLLGTILLVRDHSLYLKQFVG